MWKGINELSESLLLGILFFILLNLTLQNYEVVGDSMVPNYNQGDRLLLLKFSYLKTPNSDEYIKPFNPKRGDVVVFNYPNNPERKFIKRVIGISGDTIEISKGKIYLDDSRINESYLDNDKYKDLSDFGPVTISKGHVFVLGDNRWVSNDSRNWGELSYDYIIGEPMIKYWPLN
tara:strand:+ start:3341 stop:3865 length:525 start_codon:yes stop_codon:yes gene_type:complete